ncbi:hypothetical protein [Mediterraneibacter massiliensis]|uniref:hypothetical protein n=1 Tax=Mediterraneibacter massiliensis TaxID=1720300 RepID=UPI0022E47CF8|nr:hypothetical protein [Mediterraneibacter massiliensis]
MPEKLRWNEREDVRPCILCNEVCVRRLYENRVIFCAVNPQAVRGGFFAGWAVR